MRDPGRRAGGRGGDSGSDCAGIHRSRHRGQDMARELLAPYRDRCYEATVRACVGAAGSGWPDAAETVRHEHAPPAPPGQGRCGRVLGIRRFPRRRLATRPAAGQFGFGRSGFGRSGFGRSGLGRSGLGRSGREAQRRRHGSYGQHPAERTQHPSSLRCGFQQLQHVRVTQQVLHLCGKLRRLGHQPDEPGVAFGQTLSRLTRWRPFARAPAP